MKRYSILPLIFVFLVSAVGCVKKSPTSPNANTWVKMTGRAPFAPRYGHSGTVFNNSMWVIGGAASDASASVTYYYGDVWSSGNGSSWTQVSAGGPFGGRYGSQVLTYNGQMWLIGGNQSGAFKNDVWSSTDGANWTQVLSNGPPSATQFSAREDFGAVVFNNAMWVIGGWDGSSRSDVWTSTNGVNWNQASNGAFTGRWGHVAVSYNNLMWVIGGATGGPAPKSVYSDAWSSPNGIAWTRVSNGNAFGELYYSQAVANNNQIWLTAGHYYLWGAQNIVYTTANGVNWAPTFNNFPARFYHLSLSFNNQVWVIGGMNNLGSRTYYNDVWHSP